MQGRHPVKDVLLAQVITISLYRVPVVTFWIFLISPIYSDGISCIYHNCSDCCLVADSHV